MDTDNQTVSSSFQLRFGQRDNYPAIDRYSDDGLSIDNLIISTTSSGGTPFACSDGGDVLTWLDKSGNGNHPTLE